MSQFEQLLSVDPIGAFDKIREDYLRYFKTSYCFRGNNEKYRDLDDRKNKKLEENDNLSKELYCELLPKYATEKADLVDLCDPQSKKYRYTGKIKSLPNGFADFIACGLMRDDNRTIKLGRFATYNPYVHQFEMLKEGYGKGKNVLITSGTGSGKTESFMLPLFASLLNEAQGWPAPLQPYNASFWELRDEYGKYVPNQRKGEDRKPALRALLLYPMNALVADQVSRLRKALDSDDVRTFLDNNCKGNRIFFGSYNGDTLKAKGSAAEELEKLKDQTDGLALAAQNGDCDEDDIYVAPRVSDSSFTSEMLVRDDMQETAPDILITNVSMLSIMMMRCKEQKMLNDTKKYFKNNPSAVFHLVVDELHLHRGTAGAEVAYLLRMFLDRIGVPPMKNGKRNPQLRIYASSASIGEGQKANQYLEDFFGVYDKNDKFVVQGGGDVLPNKNNVHKLDYNKFEQFYINNHCRLPYYEQMDHDNDPAKNEEPKLIPQTEKDFLNSIKYEGAFNQFVEDYAETIYNDLLKVAGARWNSEKYEEAPHTFAVSELKKLPGNPSDNAIRGFLIFRGAVKHNLLPSIRFHQFYKYIEGLWGELLPDDNSDGPIGELSYSPQEVSSNGEHKMLELLRCECCGELFIGGNRSNTKFGLRMSLNDPNIERIPNMQATPMVQRKCIDDYIVFWPHKSASAKDVVNGFYSKEPQNNVHERFGLIKTDGKPSSNKEEGLDDGHGAWKEAYLNPFDGSIRWTFRPKEKTHMKKYIRGFVYYPTNIDRTAEISSSGGEPIKALPCKCPACEKDYLLRQYTQSPIRSFRTGMGRNNQILSKELLRQLDPNGKHQPKLVSFSDSRQDAAELSKLVSREHYRDMLRLLFVQIIKNKIEGYTGNELAEMKEDIKDWLTLKKDNDFIIKKINKEDDISDTEKNALINIIKSSKSNADKILDVLAYAPRIDIIDLNRMITKGNNVIDGELVQELLKIGVNPEGTDHDQLYPNGKDFWDHYFDFTNNKLANDKKITRNKKDKSYSEWIITNMQANIFSNCFGLYMNVNTEAAGLGYVMPSDITNKKSVENLRQMLSAYLQKENLNIEDVLSAMIRVFGDHYRYDGDFKASKMDNYDDGKHSYRKNIKKIVKKLAELSKLEEVKLGQALHKALVDVAIDSDGKLLLSKPLRFKLMHKDDVYYKCGKCGRVHLHRGFGFCTNPACREPLPTKPSGKVGEKTTADDEILWENYISFDVMKEPHRAKRMHSEELSGQTDNQTDRLLKFKDIIIDPDSEPKANKIDLLSVTTTMEVGVDIGSLQAIYQGNMPPTRYNYQQRVGRAGRRKQAFSAALTFCRGRSHDAYYYDKGTLEITGGKPDDPTISVNPIYGNEKNLVFLKRIILKHIIMLISKDRIDWAPKDGTNGQLGGRKLKDGNWKNDVYPVIENWIQNNHKDIEDIIKYYISQYVDANSPIINELLEWVEKKALNLMDMAIGSSLKDDNALAVAEAGLLPMYGLPSVIRNFYHSGYMWDSKEPSFKEIYNGIIDREIGLAITEFAPGAMKTKDNAEYLSAGLTVPLDYCPRADSLSKLKDNKNDLDPLEYSYNIRFSDDEICNITPYDENEIKKDKSNVKRLVIPKAFRTDVVLGNKGNTFQEDDSRSAFMPVTIWVDAKLSQKGLGINGGAAKWEMWNNDNQKEVWDINTNNGRGFEGALGIVKHEVNVNKNNKNYTAEPKFLTTAMPDEKDKKWEEFFDCAPNFMIVNCIDKDRWTLNKKESIIIGTKKVTDVLCLSLDVNSIPKCLNLQVNDDNRSAIIAAFYSAATLIQRTFADKIDIAPEEIEVSEVKIDPDTNLPSVYLSDTAANGAGFVTMLGRDLENILRDIVSEKPTSKFIQSIRDHHKKCETSCPKCINTFYNRGLHHVLDWRLGMDVIKLMVDKTYTMGYNDLSDTPYGDLATILNKLGDRVQNAHPAGDVIYTSNDGSDWHTGFFKTIPDDIIEHLVHPFWNVSDQETTDGYKAQSMFKLLRNVKPTPVKAPKKIQDPPVSNNTPQSTNTKQSQYNGDSGCGSMG